MNGVITDETLSFVLEEFFVLEKKGQEHYKGIHDRFLRDPVHRQNKSTKRWTNLQKKTIRIITLQRNLEDTKDNGISP